MEKIGLQLYSIKELTAVDFIGTLEKVGKLGYDGVEFAGYFNTTSKELKKVLTETGLKAAGSHIGIDDLNKDIDRLIEYSLEIGSPYIICPYLQEEMRNSTDSYKRTSDSFNKIGRKCKESGIKFGYHNHDFEFKKFDGEFGLDLLVKNTEPELMFIELDTFWVEFSDLKSVDFIEKYKERCKILHIKEMKSLTDKKNTEIGKGIMDFKGITGAGKKVGVEWFTVEQESFDIPQLKSVEESLSYLRGIL
jgi:sugar phosphate isomerase/epimerase